MKRVILTSVIGLAFLLALISGVAISAESDKKTSPPVNSAEDKGKNAHIQSLKAKLSDLEDKIRNLRDKDKTATGKEKEENNAKIKDLESKRNQTDKDLKEAEKSDSEKGDPSRWQKIKGKVGDKADDLRSDYKNKVGSSHKRENYLQDADARLRAADQRIAALKAQAKTAKGAEKKRLNSQVAAAAKLRAEADKKYQEFKAAGDDQWKDLKGDLEKALKDLEDAVK
jgi:chromosome segregation ATPase